MGKFLTFLLFVSISFVSIAQEPFKKNSVYVEMFGNGIAILSINYEHQLKDEPGFAYRLGLGFNQDYDFSFTLPLGVDYLVELRHQRSFLDLGAGVTMTTASTMKTFRQQLATGRGDGEYILSFVPSIGYRQHIIHQKFMWRLSLSTVVNKYRSFPFVGLSAGMRF